MKHPQYSNVTLNLQPLLQTPLKSFGRGCQSYHYFHLQFKTKNNLETVLRRFENIAPGAVFTTLYFLRNLGTGPIS